MPAVTRATSEAGSATPVSSISRNRRAAQFSPAAPLPTTTVLREYTGRLRPAMVVWDFSIIWYTPNSRKH